MRKLFFTIPVVLALLVSAVFPVQKAMAAATATWTCVTGGATVTWSGVDPTDDIFVTTPAGTTPIGSAASGTRTFLNGNGTYTFSVINGRGTTVFSSSITCPTTTTTTTTDGDDDGDGVPNDKDECPKDKNAKKDKNGYCPSDETGKRLTNGHVVVYDMNDSTEIQFYTGDGKKLGGVDESLLEDFASSPLGTTINLPTRDGKSYSLTNGGNGRFTGKYDGKDFDFYLPGLVKKPVCDEAALARAKARLAAAEQAAIRARNAAFDAHNAAVEKADFAARARFVANAALDTVIAAKAAAIAKAAAAAKAAARADAIARAVARDATAASEADAAADDAKAAAADAKAALDNYNYDINWWAAADAQARAAAQANGDAMAADADAKAAAADAQRDADAAQAVYDSLKKNCP